MNTAFIGLDYIIDISHPNGKLAKGTGMVLDDAKLARINEALAIARQKAWLSVLVKVGFAPGYVNQPKASPIFGGADKAGALELGTKGAEFHPAIRAERADLVVVKPRVSAFYATDLEAALRARKIERVVLGGVSTALAVQAAARDAHDRDYQVVVVEDICAAATADEHAASIDLLRRIASVVTTKDLARL